MLNGYYPEIQWLYSLLHGDVGRLTWKGITWRKGLQCVFIYFFLCTFCDKFPHVAGTGYTLITWNTPRHPQFMSWLLRHIPLESNRGSAPISPPTCFSLLALAVDLSHSGSYPLSRSEINKPLPLWMCLLLSSRPASVEFWNSFQTWCPTHTVATKLKNSKKVPLYIFA